MKCKKELNKENLNSVSGAAYVRVTNEKPDGNTDGRMVRERNSINMITGSKIYTNW